MIIKCTNCDGALIYDVHSKKMKCKYCNSLFEISKEYNAENNEESLECNVFSCTTCGAELSVNGVETSTFCAYCGQPTIIFARVSKMKKPDKIIPFEVTKEEAINSIKKRFNKGFFIPSEIKNFEVERMNGIYIPYWLFDVSYYDNQTLRGKSGKYYHNYYREAEAEFTNMTVDASANMNDESSQRLEPFYTNELYDFREEYLSGFYADAYDVRKDDLSRLAVSRCASLFDKEMIASVNASEVEITNSSPKVKVNGNRYAMLPAWFMTIRYDNKPYTMLVNGQTGKTVGAVPINKKKVLLTFLSIMAVLTPIAIMISIAMFNGLEFSTEPFEDFISLIFGFGVVIVGAIAYGLSCKDKLEKHISHTSAKEMYDFSKDRQKGDA